MDEKTYIAIDLKSFYASVECLERGLDPLTTNLVVADGSRTEKTICLAVTPSLKSYGVSGRARLFEVVEKVKEVNIQRQKLAPSHRFTGSSYDNTLLPRHPDLKLDYIVAPPRMALYMEYSTRVYKTYLKYIAPEDIHVYSIDEVFIDATSYIKTYGLSPHDLAMKMILDVLSETGITATAGIAPNLFLCKVAMDIEAKHMPADKNGVRIAELDEMSYRRLLWNHRPITDFWRVGKGYAKRLAEKGLYTMGDIALCSVGDPGDYYNEGLLYDMFGVNAELLIDHAWGWEPCTIADIKAYKPSSNSICSGQVLKEPYSYEKTKLVLKEMLELLSLDLVDKCLVTNQLVLTIGYDIENLTNPNLKKLYKGPVTKDAYGRRVPKHAHGTTTLDSYTSSTKLISESVLKLFDKIINPDLLVRRISISANHVIDESKIPKSPCYEQLDFFTDYQEKEAQEKAETAQLKREKDIQKAMISIKKKYGKNAILKGMNFEEGATTIERNGQIGGHKA